MLNYWLREFEKQQKIIELVTALQWFVWRQPLNEAVLYRWSCERQVHDVNWGALSRSIDTIDLFTACGSADLVTDRSLDSSIDLVDRLGFVQRLPGQWIPRWLHAWWQRWTWRRQGEIVLEHLLCGRVVPLSAETTSVYLVMWNRSDVLDFAKFKGLLAMDTMTRQNELISLMWGWGDTMELAILRVTLWIQNAPELP